MCSDCPITKLIDAFNSSQNYLSNDVLRYNYNLLLLLGNARWNSLEAPSSLLYPWDSKSTYIKPPPFFADMDMTLPPVVGVAGGRVLLNLGDSVTTDHISPAGSISRNSPAARYLGSRG